MVYLTIKQVNHLISYNLSCKNDEQSVDGIFLHIKCLLERCPFLIIFFSSFIIFTYYTLITIVWNVETVFESFYLDTLNIIKSSSSDSMSLPVGITVGACVFVVIGIVLVLFTIR